MLPDKRDGPRRGRPEVSPRRSTTTSITGRGDVANLDPDLWVALAVLDRVFGTDQVTVLTVLSVVPRRRS
jgi:hypothetical protein